jgi:hypothetical protein
MSWEWQRVASPCPCGKGEVSYKKGSDDWGRHDTTPLQIDCPICQKTHCVETTENDPTRVYRKKVDLYSYRVVLKGGADKNRAAE